MQQLLDLPETQPVGRNPSLDGSTWQGSPGGPWQQSPQLFQGSSSQLPSADCQSSYAPQYGQPFQYGQQSQMGQSTQYGQQSHMGPQFVQQNHYGQQHPQAEPLQFNLPDVMAVGSDQPVNTQPGKQKHGRNQRQVVHVDDGCATESDVSAGKVVPGSGQLCMSSWGGTLNQMRRPTEVEKEAQ